MRIPLVAAGAVAAVLVASPLAAQAGEHLPEAAGHHADAQHHAEHANELMVFVGDTRKGGHNSFTVGLDYMRSIGHHWGIGIFLDHAREEFEREYIAGLGVFMAPFAAAPGLHLFAGGGVERIDEDHADGHGTMGHAWEHEDVAIARVGASWAVHVGSSGRWVFAPQAYYDVVDGHGRNAWVFGAGLGMKF